MNIKLAGIDKNSIVDGPGLRYVIFTQGCTQHCIGCHNPETWDRTKGQWYDIDMIETQINQDPLISGITLSGGEPFLQPRECYEIAKFTHSLGLSVWCYTGLTFEYIWHSKSALLFQLLEEIDVLVDGPFKQELKSLELKFKGSSNQRIIDIKKTFKKGIIEEVIFDGTY